jgi:hypothetical protein
MGTQIVKQPDGKYAVWDSTVDNFVYICCTPEEIIEAWVIEAREDITRRVNSKVEKLNAGGKPYYQFTQTWEECLADIKNIHGETEVANVLREVVAAISSATHEPEIRR